LPAVDARAVAKAWLVELIAGATLEEAVAVPTGELAREGPGLADAVFQALSDDVALMRLAPGGNLAWLSARASVLAGAAAPGGGVRAAEALRRGMQAAILSAGRLDATTTAELADRLAHVCAVVAEAAAGERQTAPVAEPVAEAVAEAAPPVAQPSEGPGAEREPPPVAEAPRIDPRPAPVAPPGDEAEVVSLHRAGSEPAERLRARTQRQAEAGSWRSAVERRLERHAHDGSPFALLAVEADGVERLLAAQAEGEVDTLLDALERGLAAELRPADQLLRAGPGHYWVTAPDTGPAVARLLAERLAESAAAAGTHHGTPLTVSIGVATCPENGEDADALAASADRAVFAARAAGTPVA
jgi:GGDEF domain-containing protein